MTKIDKENVVFPGRPSYKANRRRLLRRHIACISAGQAEIRGILRGSRVAAAQKEGDTLNVFKLFRIIGEYPAAVVTKAEADTAIPKHLKSRAARRNAMLKSPCHNGKSGMKKSANRFAA